METRTLNDVFFTVVGRDHERAMLTRRNGEWTPISAAQLHRWVTATARQLQSWGIKQGDRVVILSENRPEWAITDFATLLLGGIVVPIYATQTAEQVLYVLQHSEARVAFVSSSDLSNDALSELPERAVAMARLAPEDKFPAQIDDVEAAYRWLLGQGYDPSRIASSGDSIGGNFAVNLALTLQRKNAPLPGAVLSMSPWFDMELKNESIDTNASVDKMLSRDLLRGFSDSMLDGTGIAITDPRINLAYADPAGLPPTMIYYGGYELRVDDANEFAKRARAAGVDLELRSLPEGQHNFFLGEMGAWLRSKIGLTLSTA